MGSDDPELYGDAVPRPGCRGRGRRHRRTQGRTEYISRVRCNLPVDNSGPCGRAAALCRLSLAILSAEPEAHLETRRGWPRLAWRAGTCAGFVVAITQGNAVAVGRLLGHSRVHNADRNDTCEGRMPAEWLLRWTFFELLDRSDVVETSGVLETHPITAS